MLSDSVTVTDGTVRMPMPIFDTEIVAQIMASSPARSVLRGSYISRRAR